MTEQEIRDEAVRDLLDGLAVASLTELKALVDAARADPSTKGTT